MNLHVWAEHIAPLFILSALDGAWQTVYPQLWKKIRKGFSKSSRGVQIWHEKLMKIPWSQKCYGIKNPAVGGGVMEQTVHWRWIQVSLSVLCGEIVKLLRISLSLWKRCSNHLAGSMWGLSDIICAKFPERSLISSSWTLLAGWKREEAINREVKAAWGRMRVI